MASFLLTILALLSNAQADGRASDRVLENAFDDGVIWFSSQDFDKLHPREDAFGWLNALDPGWTIPREYRGIGVNGTPPLTFPVNDPAYDPKSDPLRVEVYSVGPFGFVITERSLLRRIDKGKYGSELKEKFAGAAGILMVVPEESARSRLSAISQGDAITLDPFRANHAYRESLVRPGERFDPVYASLILKGQPKRLLLRALEQALRGDEKPVVLPIGPAELDRLRDHLAGKDNRVRRAKLGSVHGRALYPILQVSVDVVGLPLTALEYAAIYSWLGITCAFDWVIGKNCMEDRMIRLSLDGPR